MLLIFIRKYLIYSSLFSFIYYCLFTFKLVNYEFTCLVLFISVVILTEWTAVYSPFRESPKGSESTYCLEAECRYEL